jgi:16S rRNA (guanine527-N7)-methyltransferase
VWAAREGSHLQLRQEQQARLTQLLDRARGFGFFGPGPVEEHLARSLAFAAFVTGPPLRAADLGSGGGVPALVLAVLWPGSEWVLVESNQRRAEWLRHAVADLGLEDRCTVVCDRAETVARTELRHACDLVTARSFAPPGTTAECAAPLLRLGGELLVAEPPEGEATLRWAPEGLLKLGLRLRALGSVVTSAGPAQIAALACIELAGDRYPRRVGIPSKRPLF